MISITDIIPISDGWGETEIVLAQRRVADAYAALFSGKGGIEDANLVLVDLVAFARYQNTVPLGTSSDVLQAIEGRRAVAARIIEAILKAGGNIDGLHQAVLRTPLLDEEN